MIMTDNINVSIKDSQGIEIGTAVVGEKPYSVVATSSSYESEYVIKILTGSNTEEYARKALQQAIPDKYIQNAREFVRKPVTVEDIAPDYWLGKASYAVTVSTDEAAKGSFAFDTSGGTQHITNSNHTDSYGTSAPDFNGAIGVNGKSVQGVDIYVPGYKFQKVVSMNNELLTMQYSVNLAKLTSKINQAPFLGFATGEVMFLGASGSVEQINGVNVEGNSDITFQFSAVPNRENYTVGGITVAAKLGWDYQWVFYQFDDSDPSNILLQKPRAVYIEQVYKLGDFSILPIG